ncbi:Aldolase-type TIM barrel, partial [Cynara cardunculus var. scolymus]
YSCTHQRHLPDPGRRCFLHRRRSRRFQPSTKRNYWPPSSLLLSINNPFMAFDSVTQTLATCPHNTESPTVDAEDDICSETVDAYPESVVNYESSSLGRNGYLTGDARIEGAWAHWKKLGEPKLIVAPMVDNSELPFRLLCRKYGAEAAYTPMLHSRIFTENEKYRSQEFTTCKVTTLCKYAELSLKIGHYLFNFVRMIQTLYWRQHAGWSLIAITLTLIWGKLLELLFKCPQRIAKRGNYGAFLMDKLPLVKSLVEKLALNLNVPVSCKIRVFPDLQDTLNYAKMLEDAGCALLAVHGRTRDEKDGKKIRADWKAIRAVKNTLRIPVLANGNIRHMDDVKNCLEETGADGVLSAETLLENPALFAGFRTIEWVSDGEDGNQDSKLDQAGLVVEYLKLCEKYPVPWRMIRAHVHKMLGEWFRIHPHVRDDFNAQSILSFEFLYGMVDRLRELGVSRPLYVKNTSSKADLQTEV